MKFLNSEICIARCVFVHTKFTFCTTKDVLAFSEKWVKNFGTRFFVLEIRVKQYQICIRIFDKIAGEKKKKSSMKMWWNF